MTKDELFGIKPDKPDKAVYDAAKANFDALAKPIDGFGCIEDIICRIAAIHKSERPDISKSSSHHRKDTRQVPLQAPSYLHLSNLRR